MARIAGIDLPKNKRGEIGLTYIYGIGRTTAQNILSQAGISFDTKVQEWTDEQLTAIRNIINDNIKVEGALRSEVQLNIKRVRDFQFVVNVLRTTLVLEKVNVRQLQVRKKQLNNRI